MLKTAEVSILKTHNYNSIAPILAINYGAAKRKNVYVRKGKGKLQVLIVQPNSEEKC